MARSVRLVATDGRAGQSIIETSDGTWAETDVQQLGAGRPSMDAGEGDRPGPLSLGVAISISGGPSSGDGPKPREPRLVVVGDSDFVANYSVNVPGNAEIFLSMIRWLAQEDPVTIAPRVAEERLLDTTSSQVRYVWWLAMVLLPGLAIGMAAYLRRRAPRPDSE
jgi:hypothetical protein